MALSLIRSVQLKEIVGVFDSNMGRTATFAIMPTSVAFSVRRDQVFFQNAILKTTGKSAELMDFLTLKSTPEILAEVNRSALEYKALPAGIKDQLRGILGVEYIEELLAEHPAMQKSIEALFESVVMGSWTAFETLAADLWAAGVDFGKPEVCGRVLLSNQWEKPDEGIKPQHIPLLESNPKTHVGSFYKEIGKVSFQKLHVAKRYYGIAYGEEAEHMFDSVCGGDIWLLSAFRNAIAHCAGKADRQFVLRMDRFPEFKHIKSGDPLALDGAIVKRLRHAAMSLGVSLIGLVDRAISPSSP